MSGKTIVVAVGGNALIRDRRHTSIQDQYLAVCETVKPLIRLIRDGWNLIITHGNGPQVGYILRRSELSSPLIPPVPMDYAGADIQGAVGYMFNKAIRNGLHQAGIDREVVTLVTEVLIDRADENFRNASKPIGSHMSHEDALKKAAEYGWEISEDAGRGWRRVVPSPQPKEIIELSVIKLLNREGHVVITCGGGGIPVARNEDGSLEGVEAVIDKDHASALLAAEIDSDFFAIVTAVDKVAIGFNTPKERWLDSMTLQEADTYLAAGEFHKGSMEPKVRSMISFVERTGRSGVITSLDELPEALRGKAGTLFRP